jgi:hypothetical protein
MAGSGSRRPAPCPTASARTRLPGRSSRPRRSARWRRRSAGARRRARRSPRRGRRAGRDEGEPRRRRQRGHLLAAERHERAPLHAARHERAEPLAVHGECIPGGDPRLVGGAEDEAAKTPQLLMQEPDRVGGVVRSKRVGADELCEAVLDVRGRAPDGLHLEPRDSTRGRQKGRCAHSAAGAPSRPARDGAGPGGKAGAGRAPYRRAERNAT